MSEDPYAAGMKVRREVLGEEHVARAMDNTTALTAPFQDFIIRYAWGSVWARDGLDRRTRSAITLAILTALGRENELALHVRAARRNGLKPEEIGEVLLHTAVYAGFLQQMPHSLSHNGSSATLRRSDDRPDTNRRTSSGAIRRRPWGHRGDGGRVGGSMGVRF